ncbi:unnamed protein product, partial [Laminaria digitata]
MGAEWSERFFYLSGHFLRYKKQSLNLTSVNLKQTDHVELNLQSAFVETFEEAAKRGDDSICPDQRHAFRITPAEDRGSPRTPATTARATPPSEANS